MVSSHDREVALYAITLAAIEDDLPKQCFYLCYSMQVHQLSPHGLPSHV